MFNFTSQSYFWCFSNQAYFCCGIDWIIFLPITFIFILCSFSKLYALFMFLLYFISYTNNFHVFLELWNLLFSPELTVEWYQGWRLLNHSKQAEELFLTYTCPKFTLRDLVSQSVVLVLCFLTSFVVLLILTNELLDKVFSWTLSYFLVWFWQ